MLPHVSCSLLCSLQLACFYVLQLRQVPFEYVGPRPHHGLATWLPVKPWTFQPTNSTLRLVRFERVGAESTLIRVDPGVMAIGEGSWPHPRSSLETCVLGKALQRITGCCRRSYCACTIGLQNCRVSAVSAVKCYTGGLELVK